MMNAEATWFALNETKTSPKAQSPVVHRKKGEERASGTIVSSPSTWDCNDLLWSLYRVLSGADKINNSSVRRGCVIQKVK